MFFLYFLFDYMVIGIAFTFFQIITNVFFYKSNDRQYDFCDKV